MLVIASVSEAIQGHLLRELDCFASLAMTTDSSATARSAGEGDHPQGGGGGMRR